MSDDFGASVIGVANLRVADASVMPNVVSGTTNAASIMIGEKASEIIAADHDVQLTEFVANPDDRAAMRSGASQAPAHPTIVLTRTDKIGASGARTVHATRPNVGSERHHHAGANPHSSATLSADS